MTKLLDKAIGTVRKLSPEEQDEIAQAMLALADDADVEDPDPADLEAIREGLADADAGRFASDAEIEAAFRRFGK